MRVAVLSAGPSLTRTWRGGAYDATLAINFALAAADADWLVSGDASHMVGDLGDRRPRLGIWTMGDDHGRVHDLWPGVALHRFDLLPGITRLPRTWSWSSQAALAVAWHLGAREIDVYGVDMTDAPDAGGRHPGYRCAERWARESADLADSITLLSSSGVSVRRITPFPWEKT